MKQIMVVALTAAGLSSLAAQEIKSGVIHNYTYLSGSYEYITSDVGVDGVGGVGSISYDFHNFLFGLSGGYAVTDGNPEIKTKSVSGAIGYVFRLYDNHLNIIPRFAIGYSQSSYTSFLIPGVLFDYNTTVISPGLSVSYAFDDRFSLNAGYAYSEELDKKGGSAHGFSVGGEIAITKRIGIGVAANFNDENGFSGVSAGASFHF